MVALSVRAGLDVEETSPSSSSKLRPFLRDHDFRGYLNDSGLPEALRSMMGGPPSFRIMYSTCG